MDKIKFLQLGRSRNLDSLTDGEFADALAMVRTLRRLNPFHGSDLTVLEIAAVKRTLRRPAFLKLQKDLTMAQRKRRSSLWVRRQT